MTGIFASVVLSVLSDMAASSLIPARSNSLFLAGCPIEFKRAFSNVNCAYSSFGMVKLSRSIFTFSGFAFLLVFLSSFLMAGFFATGFIGAAFLTATFFTVTFIGLTFFKVLAFFTLFAAGLETTILATDDGFAALLAVFALDGLGFTLANFVLADFALVGLGLAAGLAGAVAILMLGKSVVLAETVVSDIIFSK